MKRQRMLLVATLLAAGVTLGVGYGVIHGGHRPEAGMLEEVLVSAPRADRVVEEVVVTAEGPELLLPVVEVRARRAFVTLAEQPPAGGARVN